MRDNFCSLQRTAAMLSVVDQKLIEGSSSIIVVLLVLRYYFHAREKIKYVTRAKKNALLLPHGLFSIHYLLVLPCGLPAPTTHLVNPDASWSFTTTACRYAMKDGRGNNNQHNTATESSFQATAVSGVFGSHQCTLRRKASN
jgi:predicted esterase